MSEHPIIQRTRARRGPSINAFGRVACEPPRLLGEGATVKRCQVDIVGRTLTSRREGHTRTFSEVHFGASRRWPWLCENLDLLGG